MKRMCVGSGRCIAAATVGLAVGVVAGCGSPSSGAPISAVPFVSDEYTPPALYANVPSAKADLPDCALDALSVTVLTDRATPVEEHDGSDYLFELSNDGSDCAMEGSPTLIVVSSTDPAVALYPEPTGEEAPTGGKTISKLAERWKFATGDSAYVDFYVKGKYCAVLPAGAATVWFGKLGASPKAQIEAPKCSVISMSTDGIASSAWTPRVPPNPPKKPSVFAGTKVTATIDAPDTVKAGVEFGYTLTLSNPSDSPVSLDPCPGYYQYIGQDGAIRSNYAYLNCAAAPKELAAHGSISFQMRIAAPETYGPGLATFTGPADLLWQTDEDESVGAEVKMTVTA